MTVSDEIYAALTAAFAPDLLVVDDESEQHRGHGGWREGGQTHFKVTIRAEAFAPMTKVARHRAIYQALNAVMPRIHALALEVNP